MTTNYDDIAADASYHGVNTCANSDLWEERATPRSFPPVGSQWRTYHDS
jgi:hypothetical protein